jgi:arginyl-tRNA synthetase
LNFYDRCRIFGVDRDAVQRRLLLISITQKMLLAIAPPEINYAMYL